METERVCQSVFCCCEEIPEENNLKNEIFILVLDLRGFSPWSPGPNTVGLENVDCQAEEGVAKQSCLPHDREAPTTAQLLTAYSAVNSSEVYPSIELGHSHDQSPLSNATFWGPRCHNMNLCRKETIQTTAECKVRGRWPDLLAEFFSYLVGRS